MYFCTATTCSAGNLVNQQSLHDKAFTKKCSVRYATNGLQQQPFTSEDLYTKQNFYTKRFWQTFFEAKLWGWKQHRRGKGRKENDVPRRISWPSATKRINSGFTRLMTRPSASHLQHTFGCIRTLPDSNPLLAAAVLQLPRELPSTAGCRDALPHGYAKFANVVFSNIIK